MHQTAFLTCSLFTTLLQGVRADFNAVVHTPKASQSPSPNDVAAPENVITLKKTPGGTSVRYTQALASGNGAQEVEGTYGTANLGDAEGGTDDS